MVKRFFYFLLAEELGTLAIRALNDLRGRYPGSIRLSIVVRVEVIQREVGPLVANLVDELGELIGNEGYPDFEKVEEVGYGLRN